MSRRWFYYILLSIFLIAGFQIFLSFFVKDYFTSRLEEVLLTPVVSILSLFAITSAIWLCQLRKLRRDIRDTIEFCDEVASGNLNKKLYIDERSELSQLVNHIIYMTKELKNKLIEAERKKETIELVLKNMKEGLLIIDEKDTVLLVNDAFLRLFGINFPYRGMTAAEILRDAEILSMIEESRGRDETISKEISLRNGTFLSVIATAVKFSDQGEGIILTFHDITKLKRLEQIRKDFVANVAHEIRTPITAVKGFAETLLNGAIEDRENAYRFLEIIKRHSERLNSLVNDLLTLSAIEQGEIKMEITDVNISETIDSIFALMAEKARSKGLYLKKAVTEDMPLIRADRDRLFQILLNLIDNGIKFTELGGITVGAKINGKALLYVEDTGCGIEKKHLSRLGERFYRVDRARSRELGGTGLGLAIVKHLVKAHGWDMEIESTPGKGTKVMIITG